MDKKLLTAFFNCGDNEIIEFAIVRARLNRHEKEVIRLTFDECLTQEQIAERLNYSTRRIQQFWYSGSKKLLAIQWVDAYARQLLNS